MKSNFVNPIFSFFYFISPCSCSVYLVDLCSLPESHSRKSVGGRCTASNVQCYCIIYFVFLYSSAKKRKVRWSDFWYII